MFIIEKLFIDDLKLHKVLQALSGLVISMDPPRPVVNAVVKKGKVKQDQPETSMRDRFLQSITKLPLNTVLTSEQIKEIITKIGGQPTGYTYYANLLLESGYATRRGRGQFVTQKGD